MVVPLGFFASGFSPLLLNPKIFLDASSLMLADGAAVTSWPDLSGNGNDFTQADPTKKPTYKLSGINGLPSVLGDGSSSILTSPSIGAPPSGNWWSMFLTQPVNSSNTMWSIGEFPAGSPYILLASNGSFMYFNTNAGLWLPANVVTANGQTNAYFSQWQAASGTLQDNLGNLQTVALTAQRSAGTMDLFGVPAVHFYNGYASVAIYGEGILTADQLKALWKWVGTRGGIVTP